MNVEATSLVPGIEPLELPDDALVEAAVLLVKVSNSDGTASLHRATTAGMSHWETVGMLYDTLSGMAGVGEWRDGD